MTNKLTRKQFDAMAEALAIREHALLAYAIHICTVGDVMRALKSLGYSDAQVEDWLTIKEELDNAADEEALRFHQEDLDIDAEETRHLNGFGPIDA